jgi:hypothetical protein
MQLYYIGYLAAVNIDEDDDGVPLSSYYLFDGTAEVPSDVTHVRVAPSVTVIRSNVFGSLIGGVFTSEVYNIRKVNYPKDCVSSKNGRS